MRNRTLPNTDAALANWSTPFVEAIASDAAAYGVTTAMRDEAVAAHAAFAAAWAAATDPNTRTRVALTAKDDAARSWRRVAGQAVAVVRAQANLTDAQLVALGLPPRAAAARVEAPTTTPVLEVASVVGRTVHLRVADSGGARRGRPPRVAGLVLFSFAGEMPPAAADAWRYEGTSSAVSLSVTFDEALPIGHKVWLCAQWLSPRLEAGPSSPPAYAHLGEATRMQPRGLRRAA